MYLFEEFYDTIRISLTNVLSDSVSNIFNVI